MDKSLIAKIAVVILALLFLLEPFSMTIDHWLGNRGSGGRVTLYSGVADVNLTIYSYGAYLYAASLTDLQKTQVSNNPHVLKLEQLENGLYRITLRDSSEMMGTYSEFNELGIQSVAYTQVGLPENYTVIMDDGSRIEMSGGYEQLFIEPVIEPGRTLSYILSLQTDGVSIQNLTEAKMYYYEGTARGEAKVESINATAFLFLVPWENRTQVNESIASLQSEYGKENVTYKENPYVIFNPPLSTEETVLLKKSYITYISEGSATLEAGFSNKEQVIADFGERALFPNSVLSIRSTMSEEELPESLSQFNYSRFTTYIVAIPQYLGGYYMKAQNMDIASENEFEENETILLSLNATLTGDTIIGIRGIDLEKIQ